MKESVMAVEGDSFWSRLRLVLVGSFCTRAGPFRDFDSNSGFSDSICGDGDDRRDGA